jgi:hypothetical protein
VTGYPVRPTFTRSRQRCRQRCQKPAASPSVTPTTPAPFPIPASRQSRPRAKTWDTLRPQGGRLYPTSSSQGVGMAGLDDRPAFRSQYVTLCRWERAAIPPASGHSSSQGDLNEAILVLCRCGQPGGGGAINGRAARQRGEHQSGDGVRITGRRRRGSGQWWLVVPGSRHQLRPDSKKASPHVGLARAFVLVSVGRGCGIRTREGLPPTRFPSVRPRPLGESSVA